MTSPGRLEIIRRSPTILLDAAHNPHGAAATVAALEDSFTFSPLIGVIGVMSDKDAEGLLAEFEPVLAHVVCTQNSTERVDAGRRAGRDRARDLRRPTASARHRRWPTPSTRPRRWPRPERPSATRSAPAGCSSPARSSPSARRAPCCARGATRTASQRGALMQRRLCAAILPVRGDRFGLTTPVLFSVTDASTGTALVDRPRPDRSAACWWRGCCASRGPTGWAGHSRSPRSRLGLRRTHHVLPRRRLPGALDHRLPAGSPDRARPSRVGAHGRPPRLARLIHRTGSGGSVHASPQRGVRAHLP